MKTNEKIIKDGFYVGDIDELFENTDQFDEIIEIMDKSLQKNQKKQDVNRNTKN